MQFQIPGKALLTVEAQKIGNWEEFQASRELDGIYINPGLLNVVEFLPVTELS
jgi:hypothetical protein